MKNRSLTVKVCGLFSKAIYLTDGESIYSIYDIKYGGLFFGIAIEDFVSFINLGLLKENDVLIITNGKVHHLLFEITNSLKIEETNNKETNIDYVDFINHNGISPLKDYFFNMKNDKNQYFDKYYPSFEKALLSSDDDLLNETLSHLIGFGSGLTPDFDDFLIGLIFALSDKESPLLDSLNRAVMKNLNNTNSISKEFLLCSVYNKRCDVVQSMIARPTSSNAQRLVNLGHSSGTNILLGIMKAQEWSKNE